MLAVYFARDYPDTTQVPALANPIGLEDYRSAIPPQPVEMLLKTEMAQTPQNFRRAKRLLERKAPCSCSSSLLWILFDLSVHTSCTRSLLTD
jgi:hypothetical protein